MKRLLRLARSATHQETLHADILIQIWPSEFPRHEQRDAS
jgi:hypothetical protein